MAELTLRPLDRSTVADLVCCPGGLEVQGSPFREEIARTAAWRHAMIHAGLHGLVAYEGAQPRGFVECMPAETAPMPVLAPGAGVLMCYHWVPDEPRKHEHLDRERELVCALIEELGERYTGLAALGWDHPVHFPATLLEELGFEPVETQAHLSLMWHPLGQTAPNPSFAPETFTPRVASPGTLAVDLAWSDRCPYSIHKGLSARDEIRALGTRYPGRIDLRTYPINTRQETLACCLHPWDWLWLYLNGEEAPIFEMKGEAVGPLIEQRLRDLEDR